MDVIVPVPVHMSVVTMIEFWLRFIKLHYSPAGSYSQGNVSNPGSFERDGPSAASLKRSTDQKSIHEVTSLTGLAMMPNWNWIDWKVEPKLNIHT
jgi:hypothetical protein